MEPHGIGRVEDFVSTCNLKALYVIVAADAVTRRVYSNPCGSVFEFVAFIAWTFYRELLFAVSLVKHKVTKTLAYSRFVGRMDVETFIRLYEIVRADDSAVRNRSTAFR